MADVIFRIEHRRHYDQSGYGCFFAGPYGNAENYEVPEPRFDRIHDYDSHPDWESETGEYRQAYDYFGFASVEQLHRWFDANERQVLADNGFVVREYRGKVKVSARQAVIDGPTARRGRMLNRKEWL